jgi:hypothetical protein
MGELVTMLQRLVQRLESHQEHGCCQLDARDRKAISDANKLINRVW